VTFGAASILAEKNINRQRYNLVFLLLVITMFGIGFTTLYSASIHYGSLLFGEPLYFVLNQAKHFVLSLIVMSLFAFVDFRIIRKLLPYAMLLSLILCLMTFIPFFSKESHGAVRWVNIAGKLMFQPSEFVKLVMIIFIANFFAKNGGKFDKPFLSVLMPFFVVALFVLLIYFENDFSSSFFILFLSLAMFFIVGVPLSWFFKGAAIIIPILILMILTKDYRIERILAFIDPMRAPLNSTYQIQGSLNALTSGGFWGRGLGEGIKKIGSVPYIYSDFVFVVWAEEMGFIGVIFYIFLLSSFAFVGYKIALTCQELFASYVAFGGVSAIVFQSLLNCAVVCKLAPTTGISLPFFSAGGSSLVVTFAICGLIINASGISSKYKGGNK